LEDIDDEQGSEPDEDSPSILHQIIFQGFKRLHPLFAPPHLNLINPFPKSQSFDSAACGLGLLRVDLNRALYPALKGGASRRRMGQSFGFFNSDF
jgi:hypothetical protein